MRFWGILRVSGLFILASAFYGSRGVFCSNLEVNPYTESPIVEVSEISEKSTVESSSQSALVFQSSTWDDSQLASAVLFVKEFCKDVKANKFDQYASDKSSCESGNDSKKKSNDNWRYKDVKGICSRFSTNLKWLSGFYIPKYGPGSVDQRKEIDQNFYKHVLKPEKFDVYTKWLVKNIPVITNSLSKMFNESKQLSQEQVNADTSIGPLKYGFLFIGKKWRSSVHHNVGPITKNLTDILKSLQSRLNEMLGKLPKKADKKNKNTKEQKPQDKGEKKSFMGKLFG
ncbi:secreted antigen 3 [Babesia divergens]|uniref:Secreted antigen 3 n=1 Tax=Babesia divergens TaxID=32595 RepID=A0AAD9GF70_BABDI|nr:secreted antigen 3 [Babesia divergens]